MGECPANTCDAKAAGYFDILIDVARIVVVNEVVVESLTENNPSECREKDADSYIYPAAVCFGQSYCSRANMVHVRAKIS